MRSGQRDPPTHIPYWVKLMIWNWMECQMYTGGLVRSSGVIDFQIGWIWRWWLDGEFQMGNVCKFRKENLQPKPHFLRISFSRDSIRKGKGAKVKGKGKEDVRNLLRQTEISHSHNTTHFPVWKKKIFLFYPHSDHQGQHFPPPRVN